MHSFLSILAVSCNVWQCAAYCWSCVNAPSRSWNWWFGWGECTCNDNWSGECCDDWSVTDWSAKVDDWRQGKSCEGQPANACRGETSNLPATKSVMQTWTYLPTSGLSSQSQCEANGCMWVECFPASGNSLPYSTDNSDEICSHCGGPWKGKCEWKHYVPGFLAFAGPGEHCGFQYPVCPASEGENCFCGDAAQKVREGWCNDGAGLQTFCPNAMQHSDGRSQECSWNGWRISPQSSGGIDADCQAWGLNGR